MALASEVKEIQQQKDILHKKIKDLQNKLTFCQNEPLRDYYIDLVNQDMKLSCKLTDILTS